MDAAYETGFEFVKRLGEELTHQSFDLPPFPEDMMRVREALNDPDVSLQEVTQLIQSDPLLTIRLLRMANSALLRRGPVEIIDLKMAISRLGVDMVRNTAITMAMDEAFQVPKSSPVYRSIEEIRSHSASVGALSYLLTRCYQPELGTDEAMLAGLVHDIGKFYVLTRIIDYPQICETPQMLESFVHEWHPGVGRAIIETWGFSDAIAEAADEHELLEREHFGKADITDIVIVANQLARIDGDDADACEALVKLPSSVKVGICAADLEKLLEALDDEAGSINAALG